MLDLKKEVKDIKRFNQIVLILGKEGFGYIFRKKFFKKKDEGNPERLRKTLEKLGPTFIKLGQILSLRPDLIPKEYVKELGNLQDHVPAFPYKDVEQTINKELGKPIKKIFKSFEKKPIASASISQVHKARLKNNKIVAVKVQRPKVREIMETDVEIMFYIAKLLEKHSKKIKEHKPVKIVEEFKRWTDKELDFQIEANNAKRFYKNFKGSNTVKIPKVYEGYSSKEMLTLEYIDGFELHKIDQLKGKKGYDIRKIIKNGFDAILTQVFVHGFFHGDPHPSNILVLKGNKIAFVDFGIVGNFDEDLKKKSINLFYGVVNDDMNAIVDTFFDMGLVEDDHTDLDSFKNDMKKVIAPLQKSSLKDVKVSYVLENVLDVALKHRVKVPIDFVLFGKAIVELEGMGLEYEPDFKFVDNARPFLERLIKKEFQPVNMANDIMRTVAKYGKLFSDLPDKIGATLDKIQRGKVKVDVEDTDIKRLAVDLDKSSNRMTYGMIIAAFLITGALLVNTGKPVFYSFPIVSLLCFSLALIFAVMLFESIQKERRG